MAKEKQPLNIKDVLSVAVEERANQQTPLKVHVKFPHYRPACFFELIDSQGIIIVVNKYYIVSILSTRTPTNANASSILMANGDILLVNEAAPILRSRLNKEQVQMDV